jgi:hypothetical protein
MKTILLVGILFIAVAIVAGRMEDHAPRDCFNCKAVAAETIFCDDFEDGVPLAEKYFEYDDNNGDFIPIKGAGRDGSTGMRAIWQPGESSAGSLKKSFGRIPGGYLNKNNPMPGKNFKEIWWRIDVKTQEGWTGGGADKLTRATVFADSAWSQGLIAHVWSSGNFLVLDPASGIDEKGNIKSTRYNDFANLRWLGNKKGTIDLFSDANAGKWYCVTAHLKVNTPGVPDGVFEFWVDDTLQAGSYNLNWHGVWNAKGENYMINAVFFENFWNNGSPKQQERYFDNLLISEKPILCNCKE